MVRFTCRPGVAVAMVLTLVGFLRPSAVLAAVDAPVTPNAQPGVAALMTILDQVSGRSILSGQMEIGWAADRVEEDIDYVKATTGKYPVVRGLDFGDYTYNAEAPSRLHATERAIAWAARGGIVTFSCHMMMAIGSPPGQPQFYTKKTTFDVRQAVIDGTPENRELLAKLDVVAHELQKLQRAGVTVIWRPWHECSGGWFWWGAHGPEPYKKLWRLTFDRFVHHDRLDNLIWCYTATEAPGAVEAWYPGDDVVDMVGLDFYPKSLTLFGLLEPRHPTFATEYARLRTLTHGRKVIALTENGAIPDPDRLFADGANWSYFLTWNQFENNPAHNSAAFLRRVYTHPRVITLDTYPALARSILVHPSGTR